MLKLRMFCRRVQTWLLLGRYLGVSVGVGVQVRGVPRVFLRRGSNLILGDRVALVSKNAYNSLEARGPCIFRTVRRDASILIGSDVGLSAATVSAASSIVVGAGTMIGAGTVITDCDHHDLSAPPKRRRYSRNLDVRPVEIGENVFIGARCIVLKGVTIGSGAIIGAGSVVSRDIPANVVAAGNPCRVIREIPSLEYDSGR